MYHIRAILGMDARLRPASLGKGGREDYVRLCPVGGWVMADGVHK
jgi:hypothetical protein